MWHAINPRNLNAELVRRYRQGNVTKAERKQARRILLRWHMDEVDTAKAAKENEEMPLISTTAEQEIMVFELCVFLIWMEKNGKQIPTTNLERYDLTFEYVYGLQKKLKSKT